MKKIIYLIALCLISVCLLSMLNKKSIDYPFKIDTLRKSFIDTSQKWRTSFLLPKPGLDPNVFFIHLFNNYVNDIYQTAQLANVGLDSDLFKKAIIGYYNLKNKISDNNVITIVDFNKSNIVKRMWIINISKKKLLLNTWVANGEKKGDTIIHFSNEVNSDRSSLGFCITSKVYFGAHGKALYLNGVDTGFNDNIRLRNIVIHSSRYVSAKIIKKLGHIGKSFGCFAVSRLESNNIINIIKNKTVLFASGDDKTYVSKYLDIQKAANYFRKQNI